MTSPRLLLGLAAVAVAFAAADTYVVVLALPDMMESAGIPIDQLQRGAPIVSGFLLGYVAMLPLIGRIADLRGRVPVLVAALVLFAAGSLVTAAAYDVPGLVAGRFLQGVGAGGLVPATLALVADLYPVDRRGVPLGIVSAVQELGSVIGPLYGALILAVSSWRVIFAVNLVVGVVLALLVRSLGSGEGSDRPADPAPRRGWATVDWAGIGCVVVGLAAAGLVVVEPASLVSDVTWGQLFVPMWGSARWATPCGSGCSSCCRPGRAPYGNCFPRSTSSRPTCRSSSPCCAGPASWSRSATAARSCTRSARRPCSTCSRPAGASSARS